ncbi:MAG TPA: antitoxin Xre/MbcA/ParS toxin-binding domain-containing protein [Burkholderiales bacterium]|nr:antitoxin Xre/MbcA/ParS toxin-binding domain-containing protein [Burkholderiales bacterium]
MDVPFDTEHDISASKPTAALQEQPAAYPDLRDREARTRLAKLVVALFDHWGLSAADQAALLGLSPGSRSTLARYRRGEPLADSADLISRAGHLLGIHKSLRIIFPHDRDLAYRWIAAPNRRFDGASPLDVIKRYGFEGMLAVRRYLDFERGR